jgi:hypothetical protein
MVKSPALPGFFMSPVQVTGSIFPLHIFNFERLLSEKPSAETVTNLQKSIPRLWSDLL